MDQMVPQPSAATILLAIMTLKSLATAVRTQLPRTRALETARAARRPTASAAAPLARTPAMMATMGSDTEDRKEERDERESIGRPLSGHLNVL